MFWFMLDDEGDGDNDMREMWMGIFELRGWYFWEGNMKRFGGKES